MKFKKGLALGQAPAAVLLLVLIGITGVVGLKILTQLNVGEAVDSDVNLTITNATRGIDQVMSQMSLVGLIVAMAIVIGILFSAFGGFFGGRSGGI